ncbi:MAG: hypothetical protein IKD94_02080 [Erysipelotrichaceae bacterium]|nr:hypothetical protein [Erysipelotrichaceae bacterium]
MTLDEFRILHSTVIEHYQFIESHLEETYAALSGKPFLDGLADVEKHNISRLIKDLKTVQSSKGMIVFTDDEFERINRICERRNFWVHNCYYDLVFNTEKKGAGPKYESDIKQLKTDIHDAESLRNELFIKKNELIDQLDHKALFGF